MTQPRPSPEQLAIIDHTLHRAANGLFCGDGPEMKRCVAAGWMVSAGTVPWCPDEYFAVTAAGRQLWKEAARTEAVR